MFNCPTSFGLNETIAVLRTVRSFWGPVRQGYDAAYPGCAIFIRGSHTYPEAITLRIPTVIRSYNGVAVINP